MKTPDKQRKQAERDRMKEKGLKRFEAWVHPEDAPRIRAYIDRVNMVRTMANVIKKR